jgi:uncharacterized protein
MTAPIVDRAFLGRGWSFPPTFDTAARTVDMLVEDADVASSLEILFSTAPGERIMLPQFGCDMDEMVHDNFDSRRRTLLADMIEAAVLYHEPRITLERVDVASSPADGIEGRAVINITYRVKSTNSRFNFVFPYYKREGTDINLTATVSLVPDRS